MGMQGTGSVTCSVVVLKSRWKEIYINVQDQVY